MHKLAPTTKDRVPAAFHQNNQVRAERTVDLTRQAIARLKAKGRKITLAAVAQTTGELDTSGQGVAANSILRNREARELFHQHSLGYQTRQARIAKTKRRRCHPSVLVTEYRGLRASELIAIIGQLKQTIAELQAQQSTAREERDAINQTCQALREQNTRQLAALTNLTQQTSR